MVGLTPYTLHPRPYTLFSGAVSISPPEAIVMFAAVGFAGTTVLTLARAVARRLSGGGPDAAGQRELSALRDEVDQLRGELAEMRGRVGELDDLHNRVDFAERMLAQARAKGALPAGPEH